MNGNEEDHAKVAESLVADLRSESLRMSLSWDQKLRLADVVATLALRDAIFDWTVALRIATERRNGR